MRRSGAGGGEEERVVIFAGMSGIGGGLIKGPLLLEIGILPPGAAMFAASSSVYHRDGRGDLLYFWSIAVGVCSVFLLFWVGLHFHRACLGEVLGEEIKDDEFRLVVDWEYCVDLGALYNLPGGGFVGTESA